MTATHAAFGLTIRSEIELPWPADPAADGARVVDIALTDPAGFTARWSGTARAPTWDTTFPGGRRVTVERGEAGDQLFRHAERDFFLLSAMGDRIDCLVEAREDPSWLRFLLDTVLWWTALTRGLDALHAGAVELDGGVVGVISASGGGKSTLTGELMRRGAALFTDDVLVLGPAPELVGHPGPPLMNVAADRDDLLGLGRELARLHEGDDEVWLGVERPGTAPRPLRALFLYRRGPGLELRAEPADATVLDLAPHAWAIPDDPAAARRRFGLLAEIAGRVPILALTAGETDRPQAVADALVGALRDGPTFGKQRRG